MDYITIARALQAAATVFEEAAEKDMALEAHRQEADPDNPTDEVEEDDVTLEQLQQRAGDMIRAGDRDKLKDALKKFGAKNLSSLKVEDYEAMYEALTSDD